MKNRIIQILRYIIKLFIPDINITANIATFGFNNLLNGRTALVTGGTSGIGYAIVEAFLKSGANVIFTGRSEYRINHSIEKLRATVFDKYDIIGDVKGVIMDNTDIDNFENKFKDILSLFPSSKLDILVNNAGIAGGKISTTTVFDYDQIMNTNLRGAFFFSRLVARYMISNGIRGNILNISSSSSLRPADSAYNLSKWGMRGFTLGLAKSLINHDIIVNGIAPGPTATQMMEIDSYEKIAKSSSPIGRYILPEEIANMAVFLTSNMGRSIVGDIVYMTGGSGVITFDDVDYNFK